MRKLVLLVMLAAGCYTPEIPNMGFTCRNDPTCPDGFKCENGFCVKTAGNGGNLCDATALMIPKSGAPYTGSKVDPGLSDFAACPDAYLEPNESPSCNPLEFSPVPDMPTAKIVKMAICPTANSPVSGAHDVDVFKIDNSAGPASLSMTAQVFYDIAKGDLDIGIFDGQLHLLSGDGTSVKDGCTSAMIGQGVFYVVVTGANGVDVNNYELLIKTFAQPHACPGGMTAMDM